MKDYKRITKRLEGDKISLRDIPRAIRRLAELEDMIEREELMTKEEHLKRCREHYEQGKFDREAEMAYGSKTELIIDKRGALETLSRTLSEKMLCAPIIIPSTITPLFKSISSWMLEVHQNAKEHGFWDEPRTPGELLMLITTEVSEVFEELRNGHDITETYYKDGKMEGAPSEFADIVIRVMDLCQFYGIDLEAAIAEKHKYNLTRPYKHGGKKS